MSVGWERNPIAMLSLPFADGSTWSTSQEPLKGLQRKQVKFCKKLRVWKKLNWRCAKGFDLHFGVQFSTKDLGSLTM
jgi:hypothetical protein